NRIGFMHAEVGVEFINLDEQMRQRLLNTNPHSFRKMVSTFLELHGRGYWETSEANLELLRQLYQEVEDKIEGVE
uniref:cobaltochelatase subunit CobN n=1 Tax=Thermosynechococcus sp. OHK43 TaxID=2763133 RepID=UPI0025DB8CD2